MKLISFSIENFRNITKASKINLGSYSVIVGPNNEGKSNILHALVLAMESLEDWKRQLRRTADGRLIRTVSTLPRRRFGRVRFDWNVDFPVSKQKKSNKDETCNIILEFELNPNEIEQFKKEIGSNLNGTLPILIAFSEREFDISVRKQGRGQTTLNRKSVRIADFVSRRIRFEYIPAIRTAESASYVIEQLVGSELSKLDSDQDYIDALKKIEQLQKPVLDGLADSIRNTVSKFLPGIKSVNIIGTTEERYRSIRRNVDILIDDGHLTSLERKGDGVQSLVALALMRHASEQNFSEISTVIAIEEPESHLHSRAIHELRSVIENLSENNQVVLTTHSPLFVKPDILDGTILVSDNKASPAKTIAAVRDALGVRFSDNLHSARLILLVEGTDDAKALRAFIKSRSDVLDSAIKNGTVAIDHLGGASGLRQKASFYISGACDVICFVDDDLSGRKGAEKALNDKVLDISDITYCSVPHLNEAELEDLYDRRVYKEAFLTKFGIDPTVTTKSKHKSKWSDSMGSLFEQMGKKWSDQTKSIVKDWLADFAAQNSDQILNTHLCGPLDNFIMTAEMRIPND